MSEIYKDKSDDIVIKTFIQCDDCGEMLNNEEKLNQNYYDFSFNRYLQHLFQHQDVNLINSLDHLDNYNEYEECKHINKNRVFKHQKILIKIFVGKFTSYEMQTDKYMIREKMIERNL